jgi:hypothetical protein
MIIDECSCNVDLNVDHVVVCSPVVCPIHISPQAEELFVAKLCTFEGTVLI